MAGQDALQGESLSFDPEVSGPKGRMNPAYQIEEAGQPLPRSLGSTLGRMPFRVSPFRMNPAYPGGM
jgi:hypothetical protein